MKRARGTLIFLSSRSISPIMDPQINALLDASVSGPGKGHFVPFPRHCIPTSWAGAFLLVIILCLVQPK